jgi:hypothetical protein
MSIVPFTVGEFAGLREVTESSMLDTCLVGAYSETSGDLGEADVAWQDGAPTICRFREDNASTRPGVDFTVDTTEAKVLLPQGTAITARDRVTITHRFGQALETPLVYQVDGDPVQGVTAIAAKLQQVHL